MSSFEYGPVEIYVVEFPGEKPDRGVLDSVLEATRGGAVRLLDMVIASSRADGSLCILEVTDESDAHGLGAVDLLLPGLLGEDDIADVIENLATGTSVVMVALELAWATRLAEGLANANAKVVRSERIPAPIVNEVVAAATMTDD